MNNENSDTENIPVLIDKLLKTKDPAVVGLRRIIKRKNEEGLAFPARELLLEEFDAPGKSKVLSEDERRILELEKKVIELESKIKKQIEAQKKAEEVSFTKGRTEGIKTGVDKGTADTVLIFEKKIDDIQKSMRQFLNHLENEKQLIFKNNEHVLLRLSTELAKKIIQTEVTLHEEVILNVLKKAISYIADRERLIIHVSPFDLPVVSGRKEFWSLLTEQLKNIIIEEDSRIEKGGCLIESNSGIVDARLGVQFDELSAIIEKEWDEANTVVVSATKAPENTKS